MFRHSPFFKAILKFNFSSNMLEHDREKMWFVIKNTRLGELSSGYAGSMCELCELEQVIWPGFHLLN